MKHFTCLDEFHELGPAMRINAVDLRSHLQSDHHVSIQGANTKSQLGRLHLLAHTLEAFPELKTLVLDWKEVVKSS